MLFISKNIKNYVYFSKITSITMFLLWILLVIPCHNALAYQGESTEKLCPPKILEIGKFHGKYIGWGSNESNSGSIMIETKDGTIMYKIKSSEELAKKLFGTKKNVPAQITFRNEQIFDHEYSLCTNKTELQDATILEDKDYQPTEYYNVFSTQSLYYNTVEGTYVGPDEDPDFSRMIFMIDGKKYYFSCQPEEALQLFGKDGQGKRFSFTYSVRRILIDGGILFNICESATPIK